jgi:hypothetical protein
MIYKKGEMHPFSTSVSALHEKTTQQKGGKASSLAHWRLNAQIKPSVRKTVLHPDSIHL